MQTGIFIGFIRSLLEGVARKLVARGRARRQKLQEIELHLQSVKPDSPRPKNREAIEYVFENRNCIKSQEAREMIESAFDFNSRGKLNNFVDQKLLGEMRAIIKSEIEELM